MGTWWSRRRWLTALAAFTITACGGGDPGPGVVDPDPSIAPLVGSWKATVLVVQSVATPSISPDIIQLGAEFTLNIQRSGQYTAVLLYEQQSSTEIGFLSVSGATVTLKREFPTPSTSTATFSLTGNRLTMDGNTEFDFNLDGTPEPAVAHFELLRS